MDILDTRENLNAMVLNHEQQIKDLAEHLLELRAWGTPMMEFKREQPTKICGPNLVGILNSAGFYKKQEWVGLTNDEVNNFALGCQSGKSVQSAIYEAEAKLKEKNNG